MPLFLDSSAEGLRQIPGQVVERLGSVPGRGVREHEVKVEGRGRLDRPPEEQARGGPETAGGGDLGQTGQQAKERQVRGLTG